VGIDVQNSLTRVAIVFFGSPKEILMVTFFEIALLAGILLIAFLHNCQDIKD
jgi:hypothetical protein